MNNAGCFAVDFDLGNWFFEADPRRPRPQRLLILGALFAVCAALLIGSAGYCAGFQSVQGWCAALPPVFWETVTVLGDERILFALALPFYRRYPQVFAALVVAAISAALLSRGIKLVAEMPRPAALLPVGEITIIGPRVLHNSLPSGHTASVFACVGVWIAYLNARHQPWLLALAGLAVLSRVAVGAHWPADVLLGACVGLFAAWLGTRVVDGRLWREASLGYRAMLALVVVATATLPFDGQGYALSLPFRLLVCGFGLWAAWALYLGPRQPAGRTARFGEAGFVTVPSSS